MEHRLRMTVAMRKLIAMHKAGTIEAEALRLYPNLPADLRTDQHTMLEICLEHLIDTSVNWALMD